MFTQPSQPASSHHSSVSNSLWPQLCLLRRVVKLLRVTLSGCNIYYLQDAAAAAAAVAIGQNNYERAGMGGFYFIRRGSSSGRGIRATRELHARMELDCSENLLLTIAHISHYFGAARIGRVP